MQAVDREAVELGMPSLLLMENAAGALDQAVVDALSSPATIKTHTASGGEPQRAPLPAFTTSLPQALDERVGRDERAIVIVCGPGNNGGDGVALARRLFVRGLRSTVALTSPEDGYTGDAAVQIAAARGLGVTIEHVRDGEPPEASAMYVDALFGTGLSRPIEGSAAAVIEAMNSRRAARPGELVTLAVDLPSGLDADTGKPVRGNSSDSIVVEAARTVTLGGMKRGLLEPDALRFAGSVSVGSIGVPRWLLKKHAEA